MGQAHTPTYPRATSTLAAAWGTTNTIPPWPENTGLTAEQWSFPGLFIQSGRHDPDIVFARYDDAYDARQRMPWLPLARHPERRSPRAH